MKKEFFKKFSQAVCIAAVGLLVGSSLDYALNGYGVLANPNVFAEGTSATGTTVGGDIFTKETKTSTCPDRTHYEYDIETRSWVESDSPISCTKTRCSKYGDLSPVNFCDPNAETPWTLCMGTYNDAYGNSIDISCF